MRALLDVNVLIAMIDTAHVFHVPASIWMAQNGQSGWATCPITQNGCVRVLSQSSYSRPLSVAGAIEALQRICNSGMHRFWPDDASILEPMSFVREGLTHPRQLTDAYLLALAVKNHGRLVTFDAAVPLSAVRAAKTQHLTVIPTL
jgi:uncharacterized protein